MMNEVHVGDIGTVFRLTVYSGRTVADLSGATTKEILFLKPSGELITKSASFTTSGSDGKIQYATVANDLDESGLWKIQAHVALLNWSGYSDLSTFEVFPILS